MVKNDNFDHTKWPLTLALFVYVSGIVILYFDMLALNAYEYV